VRGFWTAELHRQQSAISNELARRIMEFWTGIWTTPITGPKAKR
jgi:hypothetical protein